MVCVFIKKTIVCSLSNIKRPKNTFNWPLFATYTCLHFCQTTPLTGQLFSAYAVIETHHPRVFTVNFFQNGFILQLPPQDQALVHQICMPVELKSGQILCGPHDHPDDLVYFLTGATVALLVEGEHQKTLAVGLLGTEGVVGLSKILNSAPAHLTFKVQTSGTAWCAPSRTLRQMIDANPQILWFISKYFWQLVEHIAQFTTEMQTHDIRCRLASWLLLSADKARTCTLHLTHEHLARMLGVRRVSITLAAGELRDSGYLTYNRGHLHIVDKAALGTLVRAC